jgi:hypothetical protein
MKKKNNDDHLLFSEEIFDMGKNLTWWTAKEHKRITHQSRRDTFSLLDLQEHIAQWWEIQDPVESDPKLFDPHKLLREIHWDDISIFP